VSFFLLAVATTFLYAYEVKNDKEVSSRKPVNITSQDLTFDRPQGLTLFKGHVKAVHGETTLLADRIKALEEYKEATADGHVKTIDTLQGVTLTCGNLEYQDLMDLMTAHDHPVLTTLDENGHPITVLGRQMEVDSVQKTVVIHQNVQIFHQEGRAESQLATFLSQEDKFILEEDPKVFTDNGLLSGRRITANLGLDRSMFVEGMADAIFNPNGKPVTTPAAGKGSVGGPSGPSNSSTPGSGHPGPETNPFSPSGGSSGVPQVATPTSQNQFHWQ
jgi:lipopolysaccharide export system protein LptA